MAEDLGTTLDRIIGQIRQDRFGGRDAPVVAVSNGGGVGADGRLTGSIVVDIKKRDGSMARLFEHPIEGLDSVEALEDVFAEVLSRVLADHSTWPR